jgi:uncharacterized protein (DUF362 family)
MTQTGLDINLEESEYFMNRIKTFLVYGVILVLCIAAFAGYFLAGKSNDAPVIKQKQASVSQSPGNAETGATDPDSVPDSTAKPYNVTEENPLIGVGRGDDYDKVTREAVNNAGGIKDIVKKGDVVLIKPNICMYSDPGSPIITDYRVVQTVANMAREYGASRIIVAEGSIFGNAFEEGTVKQNKYDSIEGVELYNLNDCDKKDCYKIKADKSLTNQVLFIPKVYMDADVVISVPKLKTHSIPEATVSLSLKNSIGVPPLKLYGYADKSGLHQLGIVECIIDINRIRKPDFIVIEGIVGGEGDGPLNNQPVDSKIIFAGKDPVAIDTAASYFMGFGIEEIPHLERAAKEGLGISDLNKIKVVGADLKTARMKFKWID